MNAVRDLSPLKLIIRAAGRRLSFLAGIAGTLQRDALALHAVL